MYRVLEKQSLNTQVTRMKIYAPAVAKKAAPGQFVILRSHNDGERIPLTVADYDRDEGSVTVIFQVVGAGTERLNRLCVGDSICDFVGPLGNATDLDGVKKVAVVSGGVGCAIAYPVAKALFERGVEVHSIVGFRNRELAILEEDFKAHSTKFVPVSDDGSWGERGLVTDALCTLIDNGEHYDKVIAIGPLPMMKFVSLLTKEYRIPTVVSMNPIMIDGTGMCGGCRLTIGGEVKFACVDGPEFDGHLVDFDEAIARSSIYRSFERRAHEDTCNLFAKGGI